MAAPPVTNAPSALMMSPKSRSRPTRSRSTELRAVANRADRGRDQRDQAGDRAELRLVALIIRNDQSAVSHHRDTLTMEPINHIKLRAVRIPAMMT